MFGTDQTLLIRALNATRQSYLPTYVGLRLIAQQLPQMENSYLRRLIERRLAVGDRWSFRHFDYFKAMSNAEGGGALPEYRNCLASSPFTAYAESVVLAQLASMPSFSTPTRAYSYLWPKSAWSGSSYEFFANGYKRRNIDIAAALRQTNSVAVVTDLKGFYPSIRPDRVLRELKSRLSSWDPKSGLTPCGVENFYSQLFEAGGGGLPIGPASAHVLGHLALVGVDTALTSTYGERYFRYVDDIIVVCDASEVEATQRRVATCVEAEGFRLNIDKSVVMSGEEWNSSVLRLDVVGDDDFLRYTHDLATYLVLRPEQVGDLAASLSAAGLTIPIQRLMTLSAYPRFRYFLSRRKAQGGLKHALGLVFASNSDFVQRAIRLKETYERSLEGLVEDRTPRSPELRRWHLQRVRRVVNTLFYLRRFSEWTTKSDVFDDFPELVEQRALALALASGSVNPVLPFFPRGPAAFSELWAEHGNGDATAEVSMGGVTTASLDSLTALSLTNVVVAGAHVKHEQEDRARLFRVVQNREGPSRSNPDLSFEDEFESLSLGTPREALATLARTRYASSEGAVLDVLALLGSEYRS